MSDDCSVCCEPFNKTTRTIISCDCKFTACLSCVKIYILEKSHLEPHCMQCKAIWTKDVLNKKFSKYFLNGEYREMCEKVIFEEEKTYLPALQEEADRLIKLEKLKGWMSYYSDEMKDNLDNEDQLVRDQKRIHNELTEKKSIIQKKYYELFHKVINKENKTFIMKCTVEDCRGFLSDKYKCGLCNTTICKDCHNIQTDDHECNKDDVATVKELNKTTRPCPKCHVRIFKTDGCFAKDQGILMYDGTTKMSQDIELGDILCGDDGEKRTVHHLMRGEDELYEVKQNNGETYIVNSQHKLVLKYTGEICNRPVFKNPPISVIEITIIDYMKLSKFIKDKLFGFKNSGIISSIKVTYIGKGSFYGWSVDHNKRFLLPDYTVVRNCDQMFCIQCHTAFSWKSGLIESGVVHNPHYFEALRKGKINDHRHRQHQGECGPLPPYNIINSLLTEAMVNKKVIDIMTNYYQRVVHNRNVVLELLINGNEDEDRLKYLTGKYDEKKFKQRLYVRHQSNLRKREERQIIELYTSIGEEFFRRLNTDGVSSTIFKELITLVNITSQSIKNLDDKYSHAGLTNLYNYISYDITIIKDLVLFI